MTANPPQSLPKKWTFICGRCERLKLHQCNFSRIVSKEMRTKVILGQGTRLCDCCRDAKVKGCTSVTPNTENGYPVLTEASETASACTPDQEHPHRKAMQVARTASGFEPLSSLFPPGDDFPNWPDKTPLAPEATHTQHGRSARPLPTRSAANRQRGDVYLDALRAQHGYPPQFGYPSQYRYPPQYGYPPQHGYPPHYGNGTHNSGAYGAPPAPIPAFGAPHNGQPPHGTSMSVDPTQWEAFSKWQTSQAALATRGVDAAPSAAKRTKTGQTGPTTTQDEPTKLNKDVSTAVSTLDKPTEQAMVDVAGLQDRLAAVEYRVAANEDAHDRANHDQMMGIGNEPLPYQRVRHGEAGRGRSWGNRAGRGGGGRGGGDRGGRDGDRGHGGRGGWGGGVDRTHR